MLSKVRYEEATDKIRNTIAGAIVPDSEGGESGVGAIAILAPLISDYATVANTVDKNLVTIAELRNKTGSVGEDADFWMYVQRFRGKGDIGKEIKQVLAASTQTDGLEELTDKHLRFVENAITKLPKARHGGPTKSKLFKLRAENSELYVERLNDLDKLETTIKRTSSLAKKLAGRINNLRDLHKLARESHDSLADSHADLCEPLVVDKKLVITIIQSVQSVVSRLTSDQRIVFSRSELEKAFGQLYREQYGEYPITRLLTSGKLKLNRNIDIIKFYIKDVEKSRIQLLDLLTSYEYIVSTQLELAKKQMISDHLDVSQFTLSRYKKTKTNWEHVRNHMVECKRRLKRSYTTTRPKSVEVAIGSVGSIIRVLNSATPVVKMAKWCADMLRSLDAILPRSDQQHDV